MSNILKLVLQKKDRLARLIEQINTIPDPRKRKGKHPFESLMIITLCAVTGGANNDIAIAEFGQSRVGDFKKIIPLPCGIPSYSTFNRVISHISVIDMQRLFDIVPDEWKRSGEQELADSPEAVEIQSYLKRHRCLDGKVLRAIAQKEPCTLVRAYDPTQQKVLYQTRVGEKTNEITGSPIDLENIKDKLSNTIVSLDAIGTQKNIVTIIREYGADYLLPIKGNQYQLHADVSLFLNDVADGKMPEIVHTFHETRDKKHGRIEIRKCWTTHAIDWFDQKHLWKDLTTISVIETSIIKRGTTTINRRYYISSLSVKAVIILALVRNHWSIENKLHWGLNTSFDEHIATTRGRGAGNKSIFRCVALSFLQRHPANLSINNKRARAANDFEFLMEVVLGEKIDLRTPTQKVIRSLKRGIDYLITSVRDIYLALI